MTKKQPGPATVVVLDPRGHRGRDTALARACNAWFGHARAPVVAQRAHRAPTKRRTT